MGIILLVLATATDSLAPPRDRFVQVELFGIGYGPDREYEFTAGRFASFTFVNRRLEYGVALEEVVSGGFGEFGNIAVLPVHAGYVIVQRPRQTAFFYSMLPALVAEAAAGIAPGDLWNDEPIGLYTRASLALRYEFYGLGAGVEAGVTKTFGSLSPETVVYAVVQAHVLTASFRR